MTSHGSLNSVARKRDNSWPRRSQRTNPQRASAAANKVWEREKDEEEEGERASDLAYLIYPPSLGAGLRTDGRASERASAAVPPSLSVAGGHAIRVESVSDCHEGRAAAGSVDGRDGQRRRRFGHSMPKEEHGTRREGRIEIKEGGERTSHHRSGFVVTLPNRIRCHRLRG